MKKYQIAIIDSSAYMRRSLSDLINAESDLIVSSVSAEVGFAMPKLKREWPDLILLEVAILESREVIFLTELMRQKPLPVVVAVDRVEEQSELVLKLLNIGALNVIERDHIQAAFQNKALDKAQEVILATLRSALKEAIKPNLVEDQYLRKIRSNLSPTPIRRQGGLPVVLIGASTGGTIALEWVLRQLPDDCPGIVVVQHMPEIFTKKFADRLNDLTPLTVREAIDGDLVCPGRVLIAPGGFQTTMNRNGQEIFVNVRRGPKVNRHCPSVDVLFRTAASSLGSGVKAFLLTGMGYDGAQGLLALKEIGAKTYAQDEQSSIVFGMPKAAIEMGAAQQVINLSELPKAILEGYSVIRPKQLIGS